MKKTWEKPQLIVLARGTSDESVLTHCKYIGNTGPVSSPFNVGQSGCDKQDNDGNCGACQARAGS
ncbi:MAG: hypothetical protein GWN00_23115 [Aliifodinibius sp.]|nr:hypothetical protein [Fodinibius sp.]NIV13818.1 hypothetical protein [Fodinibius sp.]NIY27591.1 hypothetical protein [Fodinibius sp.]